MATIRKRANNKWQAIVRIRGRQESSIFDRKTDAKDWAAEREREIRLGLAATGTATLRELAADYLRAPGKRPAGRGAELAVWLDLIGERKLADITRPLLFRLRDQLAAKPTRRGTSRSPAHVNRLLSALSACLSFARARELISVNPVSDPRGARDGERLKLKEARGRVRFLDDDERRRLLDACRGSYEPALHAFVLAAITSGARAGELQRIEWRDVDLERGTITLRQTKNGERRTLFICDELATGLRELRRVRSITGAVFNHRDARAPFAYTKAFTKACKEAQITDFRFHDTRHTAASYLAQTGLSTRELAQVLGHKTLQMVERYSHLCEDRLGDRVREAMRERLS